MAIPIPNQLLEFILLGPLDDRRQLQDTPILGDVWVAFGKKGAQAIDLLIAPYSGQHAGSVAAIIADDVAQGDDSSTNDDPNIAHLQGLVAASLTFEQVMRVVVPKTKWWIDKWRQELKRYDPAQVEEIIATVLEAARKWRKQETVHTSGWPTINRFMTLAGLILWASQHEPEEGARVEGPSGQMRYLLEKADPKEMARRFCELKKQMLRDKTEKELVWQVWLNRTATPALSKSIPAVKADAASNLFTVKCAKIAWAVIDSGINGEHDALKDLQGNSRVKRSFDFRHFRRIVSLSNTDKHIREKNYLEIMKNESQLHPLDEKTAHAYLQELAQGARNRSPIRWDRVEPFVEIKRDTEPDSDHGTHVAGIIGASRQAVAAQAQRKADTQPKAAKKKDRAKSVAVNINEDSADGMCPDIGLYDFRVLGKDIRDTEFAIIAVLQFIRYLNEQDPIMTIHGVNLSLSIPHDVRNFACGHTPICTECERLVDSGVVVVAAAGNHGYKSFETKEGAYDSYAAFSITDPGNADCVITVGATHRFWPHTYGVSFFSSRGPTGDGRLKPDLVAPGERIRAPIRDGSWGDLDGTSMAAPHVSGAAAMLMARYSELIGHPQRIKQILCQSATDLGRERTFQGSGMLDVLRAFQSI